MTKKQRKLKYAQELYRVARLFREARNGGLVPFSFVYYSIYRVQEFFSPEEVEELARKVIKS